MTQILPLHTPTILVVEADEMARMACCRVLSDGGYATLAASDGAEGVELYKQHTPSIVVTSLLMPNVEGLQTIRDIKLQNQPVRIIAMSNGGAERNMAFLKLSYHVGASCALEKPVAPAKLLATIRTQLRALGL